jgi:flagellar basal-body rod protein FlgG
MLRSLWIAKSGLDAQQTNLDVITNNLANNQTIAFKKARPIFSDLLYQTLRSPAAVGSTVIPVGLQVGAGSRITGSQRINTPGALNVSQNALDVALSNVGYFLVKTPGNNFAYTRAGNFQTADVGNGLVKLTDSEGNSILDTNREEITFPALASEIVIGLDGILSGQVGIAPPQPFSIPRPIAHVLFPNPSGLASAGGGLYYETGASGSPNIGQPNVGGRAGIVQYYTEQSNVNVAEELVALIAAQRAYEVTTRSVSASDQILQKLGQL